MLHETVKKKKMYIKILFLCFNFRYDLGPPIFLGLVGCFLIFFGAVLYVVTVIGVIFPNRYLQ